MTWIPRKRELRFKASSPELKKWYDVTYLYFGRSVQGGSTDYPSIFIRKNWRPGDLFSRASATDQELSPSETSLMQMVEGIWTPIRFGDLRFRVINPKDSMQTDVSSIACILPDEDPAGVERSVTYSSFCAISCIDPKKPDAHLSCDTWKPLKELQVFQNIDELWISVYPEWKIPEGKETECEICELTK